MNKEVTLQFLVLRVFLVISSVHAACKDGELCLNGGECFLLDGREKCACKNGFYGIVCTEYSSSYKLLFKNNGAPSLTNVQQYFVEDNLELVSVTQTSISGVYLFAFHTKVASPKLISNVFTKHKELETLSENIVSIEDVNECDDEITGKVTCPSNTVCGNTIGSFECKCGSGFEKKNNACVEEGKSVWEADGVVIWIAIVGVILLVLIIIITIFYARRWYKNRKPSLKTSSNETTDGESVKVESEVSSSAANVRQSVNSSQYTNRHRVRSMDDRLSVLTDPSYQYARRYTPQYGMQPKIPRSKSMRSSQHLHNNGRTYQPRNSRYPSSSSTIPLANRYDMSVNAVSPNLHGANINYAYNNDVFLPRNDTIPTIQRSSHYSLAEIGDPRNYHNSFYEPSPFYDGGVLQAGQQDVRYNDQAYQQYNNYDNRVAPNRNTSYDVSIQDPSNPQQTNGRVYLSDFYMQ